MHEKYLRLLAALILACLLAACDQQAMIDKMTPKEQAAQARQIIGQLAQRNYEAVENQFLPEVRATVTREQTEAVARLVPTEAPIQMKTIGAFSKYGTDGTSYTLTFEYRYPESWVVYSMVLVEKDGKTWLYRMDVRPVSQSMEQGNEFSFANKSLLHYAVLAWAIANPLFMLTTAVFCARTLKTRRKWLGVLFILLSFGSVSLNWSTGEWAFNPLTFNLLGAGFWKAGPAAPLIFMVGFPLGAILFWLHKAGAITDAGKDEAEAAPS